MSPEDWWMCSIITVVCVTTQIIFIYLPLETWLYPASEIIPTVSSLPLSEVVSVLPTLPLDAGTTPGMDYSLLVGPLSEARMKEFEWNVFFIRYMPTWALLMVWGGMVPYLEFIAALKSTSLTSDIEILKPSIEILKPSIDAIVVETARCAMIISSSSDVGLSSVEKITSLISAADADITSLALNATSSMDSPSENDVKFINSVYDEASSTLYDIADEALSIVQKRIESSPSAISSIIDDIVSAIMDDIEDDA